MCVGDEVFEVFPETGAQDCFHRLSSLAGRTTGFTRDQEVDDGGV